MTRKIEYYAVGHQEVLYATDPEEFEQGNTSIDDFCVAYTLAKKLDQYADSIIKDSLP